MTDELDRTMTYAQNADVSGIRYIAFELHYERKPGIDDIPAIENGCAVRVNGDGTVEVEWDRLEAYVAHSPIDMTQCHEPDFTARCMARVLLAVRAGAEKAL